MADNFTVVGTGGTNGWKVEYSDEVPPAAASTWNQLGYVWTANQNGVAAPEIDVTHLQSTEQETKVGLAGKGAYEIQCGFAPEAGSNQVELAGLAGGEERHYRVTYPKGDSTSTNGATDTFIGQVQVYSTGIGRGDAATINYTIKYNSGNPGLAAEA